MPDMDTIYAVPVALADEGLDVQILKMLHLEARERDLSAWFELLDRVRKPQDEVRIAVVGKYVQLEDAYKSLREALIHGGLAHKDRTIVEWVEAEELDSRETAARRLATADGILVPGGFGKRGIQGMIYAIEYARMRKVPFFGICLGMQCATIEYARDVSRLAGADSTEFEPQTPHRVIYKLRELRGVEELGGTMRLGAWTCKIEKDSTAFRAYGTTDISERHRHRYEFNCEYEKTLTDAGFRHYRPIARRQIRRSRRSTGAPWSLGCQFHPELGSAPRAASAFLRLPGRGARTQAARARRCLRRLW